MINVYTGTSAQISWFLMMPEGLTCFSSGKRSVAYWQFEAPEGAEPNMVEKIGYDAIEAVCTSRSGDSGKEHSVVSNDCASYYSQLVQEAAF
jgi:hypothetical protein